MLVLIAVASGACKLPRGTIPKYVLLRACMNQATIVHTPSGKLSAPS